MHVIVSTTPGTDAAAAKAILEGLGCKRATAPREAGESGPKGGSQWLSGLPSPALVSESALGGLEHVKECLKSVESARWLVLHRRPDEAIACAVAAGELSVGEAAEQWSRAARSLLEVARHNRVRTVLFDADRVAHSPKTFRAACIEQFGLEDLGETAEQSSSARPDEVREVHRVIARQAVAQSADLQDLAAELEARSLPLDGTESEDLPDCEAALREVRSQEQLSEENELLLLQLHQVQEELESYYIELQERDRQYQEATKEKRQQRENAERLERNLADIKRSLSWKLTIPLRALRGGPRRRDDAPAQG